MTQENKIYSGNLSVIKEIWKEEKLKGFFRGCGVRVFGISSTNVIYFVVYEEFKQLFHKKFV